MNRRTAHFLCMTTMILIAAFTPVASHAFEYYNINYDGTPNGTFIGPSSATSYELVTIKMAGNEGYWTAKDSIEIRNSLTGEEIQPFEVSYTYAADEPYDEYMDRTNTTVKFIMPEADVYFYAAFVPRPANPLYVKGKTVGLKYSQLKKKAKLVKRNSAITVKNAQGKPSYKLLSVAKSKYKKYFKVDAKTGKITVKKGLKKGRYTLKIKVGSRWVLSSPGTF